MNEESPFYWELVQRDGTVIEIPPNMVDTVKRRWDAGEPIHTKYQGSIPPHQIVAFRPTEKLYTAVPLLEEAARAFNEPVIEKYENGEEYVVVKWVKKRVTTARWNKYYAAHSNYKKIGEDAGMVVVAFRLPVHQIDPALLQYCTDDEIRNLERH